MGDTEELRTARARAAALAWRRRGAGGGAAARAMVGQALSQVTIPDSPGVFFTCRPLLVGGAEVENGTGALTPTSGAVRFLVLGGVPVSGMTLLGRRGLFRWFADYRNPTVGHTLTLCPCNPVPDVLTMTVSKPDSNYHIFHGCTIRYYSPPPSQFSSLALGGSAWLSTASFTDDFSANPFTYYFTCSQGYYVLSRVYPRTATSPAIIDSNRYKWLGGFFGNTCTPFSLANGQIFSGGDPSCVVTVTG